MVGVRAGEKIHEEMITASDACTTYDIGDYFVILPRRMNWELSDYLRHFAASPVAEGFNYASNTNSEFLSVEQLRELVDRYSNLNDAQLLATL
jgi:FlaA1/EpsC-like NDP-sugar epimerase